MHAAVQPLLQVYSAALASPNIALQLRSLGASSIMSAWQELADAAIQTGSREQALAGPLLTPEQLAGPMSAAEEQVARVVSSIGQASFLLSYRASVNWEAPREAPPSSPTQAPGTRKSSGDATHVTVVSVVLPVVATALLTALAIRLLLLRAARGGMRFKPAQPPTSNPELLTLCVTDVADSTSLW